MRSVFLILSFVCCIQTATASFLQSMDSVVTVLDSIEDEYSVEEEPIYEYWRPRYYDSIPVISQIPVGNIVPYEEMVSRYRNKDFEYVESISEKLNFLDELQERFSRFIRSLFPETNMNFNEGFYNILAVVGGVLFLFLVYKFFFSGKKVYIKLDQEQQDEEDEIAFVERNLVEVDLQHYIQEALRKENYVMAVRYQQLLNIQTLHEKGYIQWKHTKTNVELMEDISNKDLKDEFLACASLFDRIWFGDRAIQGEDYDKIAAQFKQFQQKWS